MSPKPEQQVLIVDDDPEVAALVAQVAGDIGCIPGIAHNWEDFRHAYDLSPPKVIVLDLMMPDVDGVEILRFLSSRGCAAEILLMSGSDARTIDSIRRLGDSLKLRTFGALQKPMNIIELEKMLRQALGVALPVTEGELARAMDSGEIALFYQPKILLTAGSGAICGLEALARWIHPGHGVLQPDAFIPVAERTGLILEMTASILRTAVRHCRSWKDEGFPVPVAMNLSVRCLEEFSLPDDFVRCLDDHGIHPSMVTFEVTENLNIGNRADQSGVLTRLRLKGFGLSMDDFGTGYSTLVQLARLPFTELKIDRVFVAEIGEHRESEIIIESTVAMAHSMGMSVCAEGVETTEALDFVRRAGCDAAQGFLIASPMPSQKVVPFLRTWAPQRLTVM